MSQSDETQSAIRAAHEALAVGRLDQARALVSQVLDRDPNNSSATYFLAMVALRMNDRSMAIQALQRTVALDPRSFEAIEWLANLYREQGQLDKSLELCQRMNQLRPNHPGALTIAATCYAQQGQGEKALQAMRKAVDAAPKQAEFRFHLANMLEKMGRRREAEDEYRKAIRNDPTVASFHINLGRLQFLDGKREKGIEHIEEGVRLDPDAQNMMLLASGLTEVGRHREAVEYFRRVVELSPEWPDPYELMGYAQQIIGDFPGAELSLRKSLQLNPIKGRPYHALLAAREVATDDQGLINEAERVADDPTLPPADRRYLRYALGKAYADLGEFEKSVSEYDQANSLSFKVQLRSVRYDADGVDRWVDQSIAAFGEELFRQPGASSSEKPIFVVGMIRSGTTLVDQILSSHPEIGSAEEVRFWAEADGLSLAQTIMNGQIPMPRIKTAVAKHLAILEALAPGMSRIIDKMPRNYMTLGLIHLAYPNARIIHCRRDPVDTCVSIYTTPFGQGAEFCYDRQSIARAYRSYRRIMDHWRSVIPANRLLEVDYEAIVADEGQAARKMVDFCGLEWDDACLRPERNARSVNTPSLWQVRQPVYRSSVGRAQSYEPWLKEFSELKR